MIGRLFLVLAISFLAACAEDTLHVCEPLPESCNNIDDDCDGEIDIAPSGGPLRRDCESICGSGQEECIAGQWVSCTAPQPSDEIPNGFDDDCDGEVDEDTGDCIHGRARPCGTDEGECELGVQHCEHGSWGACQSTYDPDDHPEVCDGLDNDCDGDVDEGCLCDPGQTRSCGTDEGECTAGTQTCDEDGRWLRECDGEVGAVTEVCDGLDNDCDGAPDAVTSADFDWTGDSFEVNATCGEAAGIYNSSGRAEIAEGSGWVELDVDDPTDLSAYPTLYPTGDEDWYSVRVVEGDRGACWPWTTVCAYVLRVQLTLLDREVLEFESQRPEDYRLCVGFGDCTAAVDPASGFCTHLENWHEDYSAYLLTLVWGAGCGDASRDVKIRVQSPTGAACGHYQLHVQFEYDDDRECP